MAGLTVYAAAPYRLRNHERYGDVGGTARNLEFFGYERRGSLLDLLGEGQWPAAMYRQLWGRVYDEGRLAPGNGAVPGRVFSALVLAGAVALLVRAALTRWPPRWPDHRFARWLLRRRPGGPVEVEGEVEVDPAGDPGPGAERSEPPPRERARRPWAQEPAVVGRGVGSKHA